MFALPTLPVRLDLPLAMFFTAMATACLYVGPSGLPQPADGLIALAVAAMAVTNGFRIQIPRATQPIAVITTAFIGWYTVVQLAWYLDIGQDQPLAFLPAVMRLFNLSVFLTVLGLPVRYGPKILPTIGRLARTILYVLAAVAPVFWVAGGARQTLTFNNPNQLAYYALLLVGIATAASDPRTTTIRTTVTTLLASGALVIASGSRSGLGALAPLVLGVAVLQGRRGLVAAGVALLAAGGAIALGFGETQIDRAIESEQGFARGYDRLVLYPGYLLTGAGDGGLDRFSGMAYQAEIHSTFGQVLMGSGLIGFGLFVWMHLAMIRAGGWPAALSLSPAIVYGITHNGIRTTELWILFAVVTLRAVTAPSPSTTDTAEAPPGPAPSSGLGRASVPSWTVLPGKRDAGGATLG